MLAGSDRLPETSQETYEEMEKVVLRVEHIPADQPLQDGGLRQEIAIVENGRYRGGRFLNQ